MHHIQTPINSVVIYPANRLWQSAFLFINFVCFSCAHEHQDGFVERAVQILIRDDVASITYSFGMSENTMREVLDEWNNELQVETDPLELAAVHSSGRSTADEFREVVLARLAKSLDITVDGNPITPKAVSIEPSARHHFSFVANLEFQLPESKSQKLVVADGNFQKLDGMARFALKVTGSTMIYNSNVAPIIVRAARHDLSLLGPEKRKEICTINATIASMPNQSR